MHMERENKEYFETGEEFFEETIQESRDAIVESKKARKRRKHRLSRLALVSSCVIITGTILYPEVFGMSGEIVVQPLVAESSEAFYEVEETQEDMPVWEEETWEEEVEDEYPFPELTEEELALVKGMYDAVMAGDYSQAMYLRSVNGEVFTKLSDKLWKNTGYYNGQEWAETGEGVCLALNHTFNSWYDEIELGVYFGNFENGIPNGACVAMELIGSNDYQYVEGIWDQGILNGEAEFGRKVYIEQMEWPDWLSRDREILTCTYVDDIMEGTVSAYVEHVSNNPNIYGSYVNWGRTHFEVTNGVIQLDDRWKVSEVGTGGYYLDQEEGENVGGCSISFPEDMYTGERWFENPFPWLGDQDPEEYKYEEGHRMPMYVNRE